MNAIEIEQISKLDWEKKWAGPFTRLMSSYVAEEYYPYCLGAWGMTFYRSFIICRPHMTVCYQSLSENKAIGSHLAALIASNVNLLEQWGEDLRFRTKELHKAFAQPVEFILTKEMWPEVERQLGEYLPTYIRINRAGNYLPANADPRVLPLLEKLRLEFEPAYGNIDGFFRNVAKYLAEKHGYSEYLLFYLVASEWRDYIETGRLPTVSVLQQRIPGAGLYMEEGTVQLLNDEPAQALEAAIIRKHISADVHKLQGQSASRGMAHGAVRIVLDPFSVHVFNEGDILVAEMTRPEYVPLMKKAGAIVTDAGGVLSHAAVVSREMKKPCVVGTQHATRVFKDGDLVEVDASKGVVRKL